jgi:DNA mismatch endonuclease (patch repair protein)
MASIRKRDTRPELALRRALWAAGIRGWRCHARLPGSPDLAFRRWKVAVFVDGVWWHGHPDYLPRGRRGPYWDAKIARNIARDRNVTVSLQNAGWVVIRMWDLDVLRSPGEAAAIVRTALKQRRNEAARDPMSVTA